MKLVVPRNIGPNANPRSLKPTHSSVSLVSMVSISLVLTNRSKVLLDRRSDMLNSTTYLIPAIAQANENVEARADAMKAPLDFDIEIRDRN